MEKKDLDWGNIGFSYMPTDKRYVANYKDGAWDGGAMTSDPNVVINECAGILQYCQEILRLIPLRMEALSHSVLT